MALIATLATAVAAVCSAAALGGVGGPNTGVSPWVFALLLLPGLVLAQARPDRRTPATGREMKVIVGITGAVLLLLYLTAGAITQERVQQMSRIGLLAVPLLALLWPAAPMVRYSLLISVGCMMGAGASLAQAPWPVAGMAASTAVALVALNRTTVTEVPTLAPLAGTPRRRMAGEALVLLAVAGLVGLLVSALLPPPQGRGGGGESMAEGAEAREGGETSPYLRPGNSLDAGGTGSGKGDKLLLRITAPEGALWRTSTYDRWDGRTWSRSRTVDQSPPADFNRPGALGVPPGIGDDEAFEEIEELDLEELSVLGRPFVQRVKVEAGSAGLLVAAPRATYVQLPRSRTGRVSRDGTMRVTPALGKGATYVVTSFRFRPSTEQLREALPGAPIPDEIGSLYLQLPSVPAPVRELATQLTAESPSLYDAASAVEDWLFSNTTVGRGTAPLPAGADPIERFLLVDKRGSAEQASSAMAVMLRSVGIPARVAVGFLPGDRWALGGDFLVRTRHSHAWVEAWLPFAGWVTFDPSGRAPDVEKEESVLDRLRRLLAAFWWVLAIGLAVLVRWLTRRWLRRWQERRARPWVSRCYERLVRAGRSGGRPREPSETPAEYCAALARHTQDLRLVEVGEVITAAAYSGREPPPELRAWTDQVVRETAPKLKGERRLEKTGRR